jgi:preprotein translocase subunit SecA
MSKKKTTSRVSSRGTAAGASKTSRAKAAAAANPAPANEVAPAQNAPKSVDVSATPAPLPFRRPQTVNFAGVGRNDICPCGSGKRFKNCHGH